jgi:hypothetical protein
VRSKDHSGELQLAINKELGIEVVECFCAHRIVNTQFCSLSTSVKLWYSFGFLYHLVIEHTSVLEEHMVSIFTVMN